MTETDLKPTDVNFDMFSEIRRDALKRVILAFEYGAKYVTLVEKSGDGTIIEEYVFYKESQK